MHPNAALNQLIELGRQQAEKIDQLQAQLDRQDEALTTIIQQLEVIAADRSELGKPKS